MAHISREAVKYYFGAEAVGDPATDWDRAESMHGIDFPASYKLFCDCIMPGVFADHVFIYSPDSYKVDSALDQALQRECQNLSMANWEWIKNSLPHIDRRDLLFPFGGTNNAEGIYWYRDGARDYWPVVLIDYRSNIAELLSDGSEEFFVKLISKQPIEHLISKEMIEAEGEYFRTY